MKIAINTRLLIKDKLEGIGYFTFEILNRITNAHPEHEFYFFFDRKFNAEFIFSDNVKAIVLYPQARHPILFNIWFDFSVTRALKKYNIDIFLSPDGMLSLKTKVPQIAVIHDLNFEYYPKDLPPNITKYYKNRFPKFAKKATSIITVSKHSKDNIMSCYNIDENKISVVYNGSGKHYGPVEKSKVEKPYFIYVGSLHKRKNIKRMLHSFNKLKQEYKKPLDFIVVGDYLWNNEEKFDSINNDIHFVGRKSGQELAKLVACSKALIYVSYFEGFGIPILEGMKSGVPVVSSNTTSMPEVGGDAVIYVDPFSVESITKGMLEALNEEKAKIYIKKGLVQSEKFSWDLSAKQVWEVIINTYKAI